MPRSLHAELEVLGYSYPKLHKSSCTSWYVDFYFVDPATKEVKRKKYHISNAYPPRQRVAIANEMITKLYSQLQRGWNPFADSKEIKRYTRISEINELYETYLKKMYKLGSIRKSTYDSNRSYHKIWKLWFEEKDVPVLYSYQVDITVCNDFLDYVLYDRDVNAKTRNNYKLWLSGFCEWMKGKGFVSENPVLDIKMLAEKPKERDAFSPSQLSLVKNYLLQHDKWLYLACMMEYYTMIRPIELSQLRLSHFHIQKQTVFVPSNISKNRHDTSVGLNAEIIKLMLDLGVFNYPSSHYLFGTSQLSPGNTQQSEKIFRDRWIDVRKALGLPSSLKFYSFKDAGIRDLANSEGVVTARDQARHSDVGTTNKYLKENALVVHESTKHFKGNL